MKVTQGDTLNQTFNKQKSNKRNGNLQCHNYTCVWHVTTEVFLHSPPQWGHQEMRGGMSAQSGCLVLVHVHSQTHSKTILEGGTTLSYGRQGNQHSRGLILTARKWTSQTRITKTTSHQPSKGAEVLKARSWPLNKRKAQSGYEHVGTESQSYSG